MRREKSVNLIDEGSFSAGMKEQVEPFLKKYRKTGKMGGKLYFEIYPLPGSKGTVVISHGFSESSLKFHEFIYYLLQAGYSCAVMDHRGHGYSDRLNGDPQVVHIDSFERYVREFYEFTERDVKTHTPGPWILFGHSMGGCVAARLLEEHPDCFSRGILNAPMMGIQSGSTPTWAGLLLSRFMVLIGKGEERIFMHHAFDPYPPFENECASSRARFEYYQEMRRSDPALQTSGASYSWTKESILAGRKAVKEAGKITVPVLLLQAESDNMVKEQEQQEFIEKVPEGRMVKVPGSKHEIYRSENPVLEEYWKLVLDFLDAGTAEK